MYTLKSTKGLPVYKEIFILLGNYRLPAKIIKQKRKRFGLLIDLYSENRETCAQVRTIKVGMMCDLLFSGQIMEDFQFSARVASIYAADEQFLYLELTHTRSVNTVFYRRFRQKVVNIPNAYYCCIPYEGAATNNVLKLGKDIKPCSILRVSMDGCVLCVDGECIQGMRVAIMFRAFGRKCIYYGRMGKPFKEDEQQIQENCAEVQFTQSTVVGLINLGELVYGLGGWK